MTTKTVKTVTNNVETVVLNGVASMMRSVKRGRNWTGTMTELNSNLVSVLGRRTSRLLPGSPSALRVVLNRVVNRLRNNGVGVKFGRTTDHTRTRFVRFSR